MHVSAGQGSGPPGARVTDGYETPTMGPGNRTHAVLFPLPSENRENLGEIAHNC